jgi:hypothetical protein
MIEMSGSYTEEDLSGLTPEEIEALNEDDGADDKTTLGESLNEDGTLKAGEESANSGISSNDEVVTKTGDTPTTGTTGEEATHTPAEPVQPAPQPILVAEAPADADAKLKEIGEKKGELLDQFDNGDITAKEYQSQLDVLNRDERTIERQVEKAQTAADMNAQQQKNTWLGQVQDFTSKDHPEYGTSRSRWMALDTFVKEIANDPANAQLSGQQILAKAHEMVVADLGAAPAGAKKDDTRKLDDKAGKPLKGAKVVPPQTLAKVPAADHNELEENGRWAALDRIADSDPIAYEDQLMKLSNADRDAYLAAR